VDVFRREAEHVAQLGSPVEGSSPDRPAADPRHAGAILGDDVAWGTRLRLFHRLDGT
jgi:hypothetical protein